VHTLLGVERVTDWKISVQDARDDEVRELVRRHIAFAQAQTPPEYAFALDTDGLGEDHLTLFGLRADGALLGIAALKELAGGHGEIKSMHTAQAARGRGVARALLAHVLSVARERGMVSVSLETGTQDAFSPARSLYESAGFTACGPFADYRASPHNTFMTLALTGREDRAEM
jgi:putative acetyltransferase